MLKLFRYLKKSIPSVILVILLLVVQAVSDLSLPSYTSDIVNIGIQQGGIDTTAPEVIRQSEMEKLLLFLNPEDQQTVMDSYRPDEELSDKEIKRLRKLYPAAADMPVYVRRELKEDALAELEMIMSGPLLVVGGFQSDNEEMQAVKEQMLAGMPGGGADDLFTVLAQMPEEQKAQMVSAVQEQLAAMPESILEQSAIPFVKAEYVALGADANSLQTQYILKTGGIMLLIALLSAAAAITTGFLASRLAASLGRELRGRVFRKVVSFSNTEFDRYSTASLITRSTNDIQQIQMLLVMLLRVVFYAPIMGVGGVLKVLNTNTSMAWIIALAVGLLMILVLVLFATVMPRFKLMQKLVDRLNLVTREILTGLPVIRAFSTQKYEEERFDKANRDLTRTNLFVNRVMTCMMPAMMLIMNGIAVLIVWTGAHGVENGAMQVGDMMAFIQYTMQIIMAFLMISMVSVMLPRASVSAQRIEEVLQTKSVIEDPKESKPFDETKKGVVQYRHVSFRYPGAEENVLEDIDFTALPGQTTAFIGSTGSGKSTLINLLPRFYDVTEGEILVDGVDVREVTQHDLRARLGYVPQKGVLFSGTIASNLKYGHDEIGDEAMVEAAQIAQATEFINAKPDGYKAEIAQGGTNVSGGQKQRLSIARAIAARPEILIFDDSFSALDYKTGQRPAQGAA